MESPEFTKVIAKMENGRVLLFFPETPANYGRIECWDGAHCEADIGYFWGLRRPFDFEEGQVARVLSHYESWYQCAGPFKLQRVQRDSHKMRRARWKR